MHDLGHGPFSHVFDNQFLTRVRYVVPYQASTRIRSEPIPLLRRP